MKTRYLMAFVLASSAVAQTPAPARPPRYVEPTPINFDDHAGWQPLFDGATLKGWDGPTDVWSVEGGAIVAHSTTGSRTYLIWEGGQPGDFEFKAELKMEGQGANTGVQFRATKLGEIPDRKYSRWELRGYQADLDFQHANTGALIECCAGPRRGVPPRPDRAYRGQMVRTAVADGEKPSLLATFADPDQLKQAVPADGWNQMHVIARGRTMTFSVNGKLMSVLVDDHPKMFVDGGFFALQLEGPGDIRVRFRNLWLKNLP
jgi:Domain of Unknown Function (DUF1080)